MYASVLKLQVLFIKHTSSKFIVTHFEGIAMHLMSFLHALMKLYTRLAM